MSAQEKITETTSTFKLENEMITRQVRSLMPAYRVCLLIILGIAWVLAMIHT